MDETMQPQIMTLVERIAEQQQKINRLNATIVECMACTLEVRNCDEYKECKFCKGTGWVKKSAILEILNG